MANNTFLKIFFFLVLIFSCTKNDNAKDDIYQEGSFLFATAESQGVNANILNSAFQEALSLGFIDGILIAKNGYIIGEKYYNNFTKNSPHNVKSVSKSILSAITGIAIQHQTISNINNKVIEYFPEYNTSSLEAKKLEINIQHLLTMRMGTLADFDNNYNGYYDYYNSSNWIQKIFEIPLTSDPGVMMNYNTFQTHLLSVLISKAAKKNTKEYATEVLFNPMKIDIDSWEIDPQGNHFGGNSMYFTPREMYLFGLLYLNKGKLHTTQIISENWVNASITKTTNFKNYNIGEFKNYNYGYLWWLGEINNRKLFLAYGYGGQLIAVFPNSNLIIVTTAKHNVAPIDADIQEKKLFSFIADYILPAIN